MKFPRSGGFFWRLYSTYVAVVILSATLVAALVFEFFVSNARTNLNLRITQLAEMLASLEAANPKELWTPILENRVKELAQGSETQIDVFLGDGEFLASSKGPSRVGSLDIFEIPEFAQAVRTGAGESWRKEEGSDFETIFVVRAIMVRSDNIGYVRVSKNLGHLVPVVRRLGYQIGLGALIAAGISILGGIFFGRTVTRPLKQIESGCRRILDGDLSSPIHLNRSDEFGLVADTVNRMSDSLTRQLRQIEQQKNRYELALRLLHDGVIVLDSAGRVIFLNTAAEGFCRCNKVRGCLGKHFKEVIAVGGIATAIDSMDLTKSDQQRTVDWRDGRGERRHASLYLSNFDEDRHDLIGLLVVVRDTTERRRFENLRREFASNVSHELKTPITAIATLVDALLNGAATDPELKASFLGRIQLQNQRLERLVDELLAISKLESGKGFLKMKRIDLRDSLQSVRETFAPLAELRRIGFVVISPESDVVVYGDKTALELAVNSLVDNAFKYTEAGGRVEVRLSSNRRLAYLEVIDDGCGIPAEHRERIFERFYRIESARSRGGGGSGLGLSIVKHMAIAHGGEVDVKSQEGEGSEFVITLPLA